MNRSAAGKNICLVMQGSDNWIGGTEYFINLIIGLHSFRESTGQHLKIYLLVTKGIQNESLAQVSGLVDKILYAEDELPAPTPANRIVWLMRRAIFRDALPRWSRLLKRNNIDVVYPMSMPSSGRSGALVIAWIFDFQHKYLPQFFKPEEIRNRDSYFYNITKHTRAIVVSSKTAQDDFARFLPWASQKSRVLSFRSACQDAWYGQDPLQIQQKYFLPERFFLVSNQFWQHKNHLIVFEALKILKGKGVLPTIVFTGQLYDDRAPGYCNQILSAINQNGLHPSVFLLGLIPKYDQIALMRRCIAVIQPSLFEGWSTVVENARALGKFIILSDIPVHLEQRPPMCRLFKHNDPGDLASLMGEVWNSQSPGPNREEEETARAENREMVLEFGRQFMSIIDSVDAS